MRRTFIRIGVLTAIAALASLALAGCGMRVLGHGGRVTPAAPPAAAARASRHEKEPKPAAAAAKHDAGKRSKSPGAKDARVAKDGTAAKSSHMLTPREQAAANPAVAYWPYRMALEHEAADSGAAAEADLREALAREARYAPALARLSGLLYRQGRHEEAVRILEPVRAHPEAFEPEARAALLAGLALHEDALGRLAEAGDAIAAAGDADAARSAAVYVALRGEKPDTATPLAERAMHADGHSAANQNNRGITLLRAGDPEGARKAFLAAIDRDPALPGPYYNLAILEKFYRLDDDAAARWFDGYWSRSHADPDSLLGAFRVSSRPALAREEAGR
jgi:tetratricopeptide (TPR) repeat protein